jgi:hypothetical protein
MQSNPKWIRTSFCLCLQVDRVNKNAWSSLKKVNLHNNTRKNLQEYKPCEARFPSYGLLIIEECAVSTSSFHIGTEGDETSGTLLFPHHIWLGLCTTISYETRDVDLQTRIHLWFMHGCAPPYIPLADLEFLKSMACFFLWFQSLRFSSLGLSNVYCLCYRSQWHPWLAKTNTELIFMTPGIFQQVRQSMYRHATSCVEAQGEGFHHFLSSSGVCNEKPCLRRPMFIWFFYLHCGVDLHSVGLAVHFLFILCDSSKLSAFLWLI